MQRLGTFGRVASVRTYEGKNSARKRVISAIANHLIEVVARDQAELAAARTASVQLRLQRTVRINSISNTNDEKDHAMTTTLATLKAVRHITATTTSVDIFGNITHE